MIFAWFWSIYGYFGDSDTTSTACIFRMAVAIVSLYDNKMFLTPCSLVWSIENVQVYWLFTEEFSVDWWIFLSRIGNKLGFLIEKFKLLRSWGCSYSDVCNICQENMDVELQGIAYDVQVTTSSPST